MIRVKYNSAILVAITTIVITFVLNSDVLAKDDIEFKCTVVGNGFQTTDKSGPFRHDLGSFEWSYNANLIEAIPETTLESGGYKCKPVRIESPKAKFDKGKFFYITGNRCGVKKPSYFFAETVIDDVQLKHSLGHAADLIKKNM